MVRLKGIAWLQRRGRWSHWVVAGGGGLLLGLLALGLFRRGPVAAIAAAVGDEVGLRLVAEQADHLRVAANEFGLDPYLLAGIMYSESRGRSGQISSAGALGLMQLGMPAARDAAARLDLDAPSQDAVLHDDDLNVRLGACHLAWLLRHAGDWDLEAVLVSYNAGRAKLFRWIAEHGSYRDWCRSEERAEAAGEPSTGALRYARQCLLAAERLRDREALSP